jgi:hypothetical protein
VQDSRWAVPRGKGEQYEWSNSWWNSVDDHALPRALLVGDSISCGYGPVVDDRIANSRGVHDPFHWIR